MLLDLVKHVNSFLWSFLLLLLLCSTGLYFTIKLKFVQITGFKDGLLTAFGKKGNQAGKGGMSSFQSLATAIAAQVGTGNLAGAATAITMGGPGAVFWMWVSAFLGMATAYAEATLAQTYREETKDGEVTGGPVYYIRAAFHGRFGKVLAGVFAVSVILALGFIGNMVQANSVTTAFAAVFESRGLRVLPIAVGVIVAVLAGLVFAGGVSRLAKVTEKLVPIMALVYIAGSLYVICKNYRNVPVAFQQIFIGAFRPQAVMGGMFGVGIREAVRYGVARGLFSNEAGMGSTPHAHAMAQVKHPHEQGSVAMISVFIDTFVILNLTVFTLLTSGAIDTSTGEGIQITQLAFIKSMGKNGDVFIAVCLFFFAFSTLIGWHFFGSINVKYLFGKKALAAYSVFVVVFILLGSVLKVSLVWELADMFNGIMVIPNVIALLALRKVVAKSYRGSHRLK